MFSYSLKTYSTLDTKNPKVPSLEQNMVISIPYPRINCLKTIPFTAADTHIAYG